MGWTTGTDKAVAPGGLMEQTPVIDTAAGMLAYHEKLLSNAEEQIVFKTRCAEKSTGVERTMYLRKVRDYERVVRQQTEFVRIMRTLIRPDDDAGGDADA
ncbi:hypothetical protein [Phenylobacterium sp. SCN 70-31]|uniref:hypothetical protein n=1 Tax=Phenylobacterium sp. SCN 70-31 TaxID=1660129 RepID=UPI0025E0E3DD|nr:hypothetical protein [Phenylobacterium sp. SCN 70-31]